MTAPGPEAPAWAQRGTLSRAATAVAQVALTLSGLGLSGVGSRPETPWVALALTPAVALSAATQDFAIDANAVDVLRKVEHGVAVGLRTVVYRAAMTLSGGLAIWAAASLGWGAVNLLLGLAHLPLIFVTWRSPEPEEPSAGPKTLRDAIWLPFLECPSRHRAVEILVFVVLYRLADGLSQSLLRPLVIDMGYGGFDRGFDFGAAAATFFQPVTAGGWTRLVALAVVGVLGGLGTAALFAARHGDQASDGEGRGGGGRREGLAANPAGRAGGDGKLTRALSVPDSWVGRPRRSPGAVDRLWPSLAKRTAASFHRSSCHRSDLLSFLAQIDPGRGHPP